MTKRGRPSAAWLDRDLAGELRGVPVDLEGLVGDAVLVEHEREGAERRGLDRVDAGLRRTRRASARRVGAGGDEVLVAALERLAAEVVGAEVVALHPGAERAVEHEHALVERVEKRVYGAAADRRSGSSGVRHPSRLRGVVRGSLYGNADGGTVGSRLGMKVYTRKGDDGTTGLLYGGRVGKDEVGPEAYGAVDEAVSALGLARAEIDPGSELHELLVRLQRELFVVGAELATAPANRAKLKPEVSLVTAEMVSRARADHRRRHRALRPAAGVRAARREPVAAALDLARTVVRRAERISVAATRVGWLESDSQVVPYLNRLADLVYTLARWQEGEFRPSRKP